MTEVTYFIVKSESWIDGEVTHLHCNLERHLSYGAEGGVEPPLSQVLLCYHVSYRLADKDRKYKVKACFYQIKSILWLAEDNKYLCCGEEDVIRYVSYSAGYDTQSNSREDVGIVSLSGVEGASVSQHHLIKRTSTGKDAPALVTEGRDMFLFGCLFNN